MASPLLLQGLAPLPLLLLQGPPLTLLLRSLVPQPQGPPPRLAPALHTLSWRAAWSAQCA